MEPVLDFHTHAQDVFATCCVPRPLRAACTHGLAALYEATGFSPIVKRLESPFSIKLVAAEMQCRFARLTFDDYRRALAADGVSHACAMPVEPMSRTGDLVELVQTHQHLVPFASVDFTASEDPVAQLRRHLAAGCRGLKVHPIQQDIAPDDARIVALFECLRGTEVPVLFHTGRMHYFLGARPETPAHGDPERLAPLLRRFPEQPVVLGHMGLLNGANVAMALAEELPRVYLETSFQPARVLVEALRRVGPSRLLFGSDHPASRPRTGIGIVRAVTRGERAAERAILFENGAALLRRVGVDV
jgi:hypothetical protein